MYELMTLHPRVTFTIFSILALMIGSLLNVIIYRIPLMLQNTWRCECLNLLNLPAESTRRINLFLPRSFCPTCKTLVHAWQNIPLLSYICLRGRCCQCSASIPWQYPVVEILCMSLFMIAGLFWGLTPTLIAALFFISFMICLFFIDLNHQLLPDSLTLSLLWIGLIANTRNLFTTLPNAVLSAVGAYIFLWIFIKLFFLCTGKIGMGHGDFKLFAAFGAWFGWTKLPLILMLSSISGVIIGGSYLLIMKKSHKNPIPFGPFLSAAGLITLFYGDHLTWILNHVV